MHRIVFVGHPIHFIRQVAIERVVPEGDGTGCRKLLSGPTPRSTIGTVAGLSVHDAKPHPLRDGEPSAGR